MPEVIPRVRELVSLLTERGFISLASVILQSLDRGLVLPSHEPPLEAHSSDGASISEPQPEKIWHPETRDEQARFVASVFVEQLIVPLRMHERSSELLTETMGRKVAIQSLESGGELAPFDQILAADLIKDNANLVEELSIWLATTDEGNTS